MAETLSARFGLRNWGADTDGPSRVEFNGNFTVLESNAAMFAQGTLAARPAAGKVGRFYMVTGDATTANNGILWYDNGTGWMQVGAAKDLLIASSATNKVPLTVQGLASQTANLQEWKDSSGNVVAFISATGELNANGAAYGGGTTLSTLTVTGTLTVGGTFTAQGANFGGTVTATKIKSTANKTDGTPKWELNSDGTSSGIGWDAGDIKLTARSTAPSGWLMCQGQSLLRTDYPDLFAAIGTTWGSADATHFTLPDVRDREFIGANAGVHALGQSDALAAGAARIASFDHTHSHSISIGYSGSTSTSGSHSHGVTGSTSTVADHTHAANSSITGAHTHTVGSSTSSNTSTGGGADRVTSVGSAQSAGDHAHAIGVTSNGGHSHTVTGSSDTSGSHSHSCSGTASGTSGTTTPTRYAYIALNAMIKI